MDQFSYGSVHQQKPVFVWFPVRERSPSVYGRLDSEGVGGCQEIDNSIYFEKANYDDMSSGN